MKYKNLPLESITFSALLSSMFWCCGNWPHIWSYE